MTYVIKATGEKENFSSGKIRKSILEAGGDSKLADEVVEKIRLKSYDGISTEDILNLALKGLARDKGVVARYDLKRALMKLGPSGFPFEKYFAMVLKDKGYSVKVGEFMKGKNIQHEIDVVAVRKEEGKRKRFMIECKYHNKWGVHTHVQVALYVYARFLDLKKSFDVPWVATNTKCSRGVVEYAKGIGMRITSWDYPKEHSLKDLITEEKLYPITVLRSVGENVKEELFKSNVFLVKELIEFGVERLEKKTGFSSNVLKKVIKEAEEIIRI